ncbi:hypothetical protein PIB30_081760 [Stylosanthes scabra]|uniref:Uncharacterized protein n=1 Tax=Stylosanthes scabra TaxID=79078 RepID=A0ABU6VT14_9FABA|nr:hypothetical protein [Stylosanthes scabra]
MASSSAPVSVFDEHRFRKEFNQELFNSHARKRKVIPEVGFNLNEDEYPQIMEQVALRGWRRLAAPRTNVSELMMQEFYANAAVSEEEAAEQDELPYKSFVRGIKVDFSPSNIRSVMRFKSTTEGAETDYNTHKAMDQRLDESPTHRRGSWGLCVLQPNPTTPRHPLIKPRRGHQLYLSMLRRRNPRICVDRYSSVLEQAEPMLKRDPGSLGVAQTSSTTSRVPHLGVEATESAQLHLESTPRRGSPR